MFEVLTEAMVQAEVEVAYARKLYGIAKGDIEVLADVLLDLAQDRAAAARKALLEAIFTEAEVRSGIPYLYTEAKDTTNDVLTS